MPSSIGNSDRTLRKWLRSQGIQPTAGNMEQIGREVRRTQSEQERVVKRNKEIEQATGRPSTVDARGDVLERAERVVRRDLEKRKRG